MKMHSYPLIAGALGLITSGAVSAGNFTVLAPTSVPVDSPLAIAGVGAIIAVIAARLLINRRK